MLGYKTHVILHNKGKKTTFAINDTNSSMAVINKINEQILDYGKIYSHSFD